jgi:hypothetical protein
MTEHRASAHQACSPTAIATLVSASAAVTRRPLTVPALCGYPTVATWRAVRCPSTTTPTCVVAAAGEDRRAVVKFVGARRRQPRRRYAGGGRRVRETPVEELGQQPRLNLPPGYKVGAPCRCSAGRAAGRSCASPRGRQSGRCAACRGTSRARRRCSLRRGARRRLSRRRRPRQRGAALGYRHPRRPPRPTRRRPVGRGQAGGHRSPHPRPLLRRLGADKGQLRAGRRGGGARALRAPRSHHARRGSAPDRAHGQLTGQAFDRLAEAFDRCSHSREMSSNQDRAAAPAAASRPVDQSSGPSLHQSTARFAADRLVRDQAGGVSSGRRRP